jgi:PAS domain S-box-containing protein
MNGQEAKSMNDFPERSRPETFWNSLIPDDLDQILFEEAPDGMFLADSYGRLLRINAAGTVMTGYFQEEIQGLALTDLIPAEDWVKEPLPKDTGVPGRPGWKERRLRRKDGDPFLLKLLARKLPNGNVLGILRDISEDRQTAQHLSLLDFTLNHVDEAAFLIDETAGFRYVNAAACQVLGYDREELLRLGVPNIDPEYQRERWAGHWEELKTRGSFIIESQHRTKDGRLFPVEISLNYFEYNGQGYNLALVRDITARRTAEATLRESESKYKQLIEITGTGYVILDHQGQVIDANQEYARLAGRPGPEEVIGRSVLEWTAPQDRERNAAEVRKCIEQGFVRHLEIDYVTPDGRVNPIEIDAAVLEGSDPLRILTLCRDIADRKRFENALRQSEERFRLTFHTSPDSININRLEDGLYVDINEGFTRLTGYTREEVIGRTSLGINIWQDPRDREELVRGLKQQGYYNDLEAKFRRKDGSVGIGQMSARVILLAGVPHIISVTKDITATRQAEEEKEKLQAQLLQAQKMESVGRLAGGVAHDFNNMLAAILGHAELALEETVPGQTLRANLEEIRNAAQRSADLTRQLLAFARQQTVDPRIVDLNATVNGMLKMLRRLIGEDIDLAWLPLPDLWSIKIDPSQVDQVLANLCVNARDAIRSVGKITIETRNVSFDESYCRDHPDFIPGEYVMLAVSDDGEGMSKEVLDHIFEPFFTTKELGRGTGLGLSMVYGIVKQNKGFINVYSEPGKGTSFKIYFSRIPSGSDVSRSAPKAGTLPGGGETVLLVEDERVLLDLGQTMLRRLGYAVLAASTPEKALQLAENHQGRIRLLITDVVLPGMNGRDLAVRIRASNPGLKCLFMSGYTANVIAHKGVLEEGLCFLQKPFSLQVLAVKVREALD